MSVRSLPLQLRRHHVRPLFHLAATVALPASRGFSISDLHLHHSLAPIIGAKYGRPRILDILCHHQRPRRHHLALVAHLGALFSKRSTVKLYPHSLQSNGSTQSSIHAWLALLARMISYVPPVRYLFLESHQVSTFNSVRFLCHGSPATECLAGLLESHPYPSDPLSGPARYPSPSPVPPPKVTLPMQYLGSVRTLHINHALLQEQPQ